MGLTLFCVITAAFTGLTSGAGVLPEDSTIAAVGASVTFNTSLAPAETSLRFISWNFGPLNIVTFVAGTTEIQQPYKDRITLSTSTGSLELRNLAESDTGDYSVSITPTAGDSPITGLTTLNVLAPLSNVRVTANDTDLVEFNSSVSLSCLATGLFLSFLGFNHDSVEVTASDRVHFTDGNATVTISPVVRYDQGSYTCTVSNPVSSGVTSEEKLLNVSYGPEDVILTPPPSDEYWEDEAVPLSCSADSRPPALFKWFRNEEILSYSGEEIKLVLEQSGNYSCQAFNSKTLRYTTSQPAPITVWSKIKYSSVKSSNHPVEGTSVNLTCDASGHLPTREWMINGAELKPSENIVFYEEKRVLSFRVLSRGDNGKYTCKISNTVSSQSVEYEMNVNYGPDSVQILGPVKVKKGTKLKLRCSAESVPTANFTWTKDGTTLGQSSEFTKGKIRISDKGEYTCRATNENTMKSLEKSQAVDVTDPFPIWLIILIVCLCIAAVLLISGGVFYAHKKKKQKSTSNTRTDGEGQDNSAYAQNQEVNYADVRFVKKDGGVVQLGAQNNTEYSEVRRNNNPPAARLPSYNAHMQRGRRPAPDPPTEYAEVRPK